MADPALDDAQARDASLLDNQTTDPAPEPDEDELVISFDGDDENEGDNPESAAPDWVKEVRRKNRELEREVADLKSKATAPVIEIGDKPTLASCDYDEERFETELDAFKERKAKAEEGQTRAQREQAEQAAEWKAELDRLAAQERDLKVSDYADARADFAHATTDIQQAVIVKASKNSAQLIYALGKNPERLAALAKIKDPIKLAVATSELERGLKMTTRRRAPDPEPVVRGSARLSRPGPDKELERLEKEADKTNNRTAVVAYKRKLKAAGRA